MQITSPNQITSDGTKNKDIFHPLLVLSEGSYFGEISYIFQIKNQYYYNLKPVAGQSDGKNPQAIAMKR